MNRSTTCWLRALLLASVSAAAFASASVQTQSLNAPAPAVASTGQAASAAPTDIRDIRGPVHVQAGWPLALWLLGGGLLAASGIGVWRWQVRQRRASARAPSAAELALAKLNAARAMMRTDAVREYSIAVSDAIRQYVEDGFDVRAKHQTSEEFLQDLLQTANAVLTESRPLLAGFLHHCDLAKFAGRDLSIEAMQGMYQSARDFIHATSSASTDCLPKTTPETTLGQVDYDSLPAA